MRKLRKQFTYCPKCVSFRMFVLVKLIYWKCPKCGLRVKRQIPHSSYMGVS